MTDHAHIRLKDGRDLEFPLLLGWRTQAEQREITEEEFVIRQARWWYEGQEDCQFEDDDIVNVRVA